MIPKMTLPSLSLSAAELERLAYAHRPALRSLQAKIDKSEAGAKLAEKEFYPDFTVSLEYMQRDEVMDMGGDDMYGAQLSFNLPVQIDWRQAKVAEMQASRRMASTNWRPCGIRSVWPSVMAWPRWNAAASSPGFTIRGCRCCR